MDKTLQKIIIAGVVIVSLCSIYYFIVRPEIDKQAYNKCLALYSGAYGIKGRMVVTSPQIQAMIDSCVRSGGVKRVYLDNLPQESKN